MQSLGYLCCAASARRAATGHLLTHARAHTHTHLVQVWDVLQGMLLLLLLW